MDINTLRSIFTVVSFAAFIAIVLWAWNGKRAHTFREAAHLPFANDEGSDLGGNKS